MPAVVTEMPRSRSTFIQSLRARRRSPRALTAPASWIAPPNSSSFSVSVVLPASGCAMIANVRRRAIGAGSSTASGAMAGAIYGSAPARARRSLELEATVAAGPLGERRRGAAGRAGQVLALGRLLGRHRQRRGALALERRAPVGAQQRAELGQ